jgi:hypothetical protein
MTRLAQRAYPGDTSLYLQDVVNWEPNQEIVLVTTAMRDSRDWHENEVFVVDRVDTNDMPYPEVKSIVHLTSPVQHAHIGKLLCCETLDRHKNLQTNGRTVFCCLFFFLSRLLQHGLNIKLKLDCSLVSSKSKAR